MSIKKRFINKISIVTAICDILISFSRKWRLDCRKPTAVPRKNWPSDSNGTISYAKLIPIRLSQWP